MFVKSLGICKDLHLAKHCQIIFIERLHIFLKDSVKDSPPLLAKGFVGKIEKMEKNALQVMKMLDEMLEGE